MPKFTYTPAPRAVVISWKPKFLHADPASLNNAVQESLETVFLQKIMALTADAVMIQKPERLEKFKTLMVLLIHNLFFYRHTWEIQYRHCVVDLINHELAFAGPRVFKDLLLLLHKTEQYLYAAEDAILPAADFINDRAHKLNMDHSKLAARKQEILAEMQLHTFNQQVFAAGNYFNVQARVEKLNSIKNLDAKTIYTKILGSPNYGLGSNTIARLTDLHKKYISLHDNYFLLVTDTALHIENIIPGMTTEHFNKSYNAALHEIANDLDNATLPFLVELHLQQLRKPRYQLALNELLQDVYLAENKVALHLHERRQPMQMKAVKTAPKILDPDATLALQTVLQHKFHKQLGLDLVIKSTAPSLSLQQLVDYAYGQLHQALVLNFHSENHPLQDLAIEIENLSPRSISSASTNRSMVHAMSLYSLDAVIPGAVTAIDVAILREKSFCYRDYKLAFTNLSTHHNGNVDTLDRETAISIFKIELANATTLEQIVVLRELAKKYINRARSNFMLSTHTTNWNNLEYALRDKGMALLENTLVKSKENPRVVLNYWKRHSIFAAPLSLAEQMINLTEAQAKIRHMQNRL